MQPTRYGFNAIRKLSLSLLLVLPAATGCTLLSMTADMKTFFASVGKPVSESALGQTAAKQALPTLRSSLEAIQLELFIVERPLYDPLMGPKLWNEVSEVGNLDFEIKQAIDKNGFRVGNCGSSPPQALQKMCGLTSKQTVDSPLAEKDQLRIRRVALIPGGENEVQTNYTSPELKAIIDDHGHTRAKTYQNARCVMRLTADTLESGWVRVTFLPEIHYGDNVYRKIPNATGSGWMGRTTQEIDAMYSQQFSVDLNKDEFALVTGSKNGTNTLGQNFFFVKQDDDWRFQRMLVVRVARAGSVTAEKSEEL